MQLRKIFFVGLISLALLSGCSWFNREEDVVTMSPLPQVNNQFTPTEVWSRSVGNGTGGIYSNLRPAWQDNRVFAADRFGVVKAMDIDTGKELWSVNLSEKTGLLSHNLPALLSGGVAVADNRVYIGSEKAQVYALNADDGSVVWQAKVAGEALSMPVISDGVVLVHTGNGMLQALNQADGTLKWTVNLDKPPLTLRGESAPTPAFGAAIIGGDNGRVSAVMLAQGQMIWQQRISHVGGATEIARLDDVNVTPVVLNNVVYAMAYNGNLAAMELRSGQIIWQREIGSVNDLIVDGGHIYVADQTGKVMALDMQNGTTLWSQSDLQYRNLTSPVLFDGYLVVGDAEGYLHWLNSDDGRFVAQSKVDSSGLQATPVVAGGKLLIQARNGEVYAYTR